MIGSISAQVALLAFAVAIVAGLLVGNSPVTVLTRALVAMFLALVVARLVTTCTKLILRDHLQRRKFAIDESHIAEAESSKLEEGDEEGQTVETG